MKYQNAVAKNFVFKITGVGNEIDTLDPLYMTPSLSLKQQH
jgi:hypothetical protein